ncbi:MAG: hypothetical protein HY929_05240 [Euryarchaeota archaeon]|nr:hypothetical protein [Euryarchaeota archaeon]
MIGDFHVHSLYSRATSQKMNLEGLAAGAKTKGLNLLGTSDFTFPNWLAELKEKLESIEGTSLFKYNGIWFALTTEIGTIFEYEGKIKNIHHLIHAPSFEIVEQINETLSKYGNLSIDGRPNLNISAPELVEILISISKDIMITSSHIWTPWRSILGSKSGFDSVEDCYQDQTKHVFSLETGLSCYDEKTEVLTNNGWKKFSKVQYSDQICTLNLKTDKIEFQKPIGIFTYRYKGKMYRLKTKRVDLLVTPNHKLLYAPCDFRNPKPFILKEAQHLFGRAKRFRKDGIWMGKSEKYFVLPASKIKHGNWYYSGFRIKKEKKLSMKSWLKFFGFWLAEGWVSYGGNGSYDVYVCNQNKTLLNEMKQILRSFGYRAYQWGNVLRVRNYQLFNYLKQFNNCSKKFIPSDIKFIPSDIKSLSKELLEILLKYYLKGDGHIYGRNKKGLSATTTSIHLRDDLQEIALKIGISAYYKLKKEKGTPFLSPSQNKIYRQKENSWDAYFIRQNKPITLPSTIKKYNYIESWVDYNGLVFCAAVPNHVIYIRRNGIPLWCGNSDPAMNWRLSSLDKFTLVSNSDSHSPHPWRLGREANVFELEEISYKEIYYAIKKKDRKRFLFTIETNPSYGKYHFDGHRNCNISLSPQEAKKFGNICPKCRRKLTIGVLHRVEELADRPEGYVPKDAIPFKTLLPLYEIISYTMGINQLYSQKVIQEHDKLIEKFGNELNVLLNVSKEELVKVTNEKIVNAIIRVREGNIKYVPGFDGKYGIPIFENRDRIMSKPTTPQTSLNHFL